MLPPYFNFFSMDSLFDFPYLSDNPAYFKYVSVDFGLCFIDELLILKVTLLDKLLKFLTSIFFKFNFDF